jgi:hypothetical protein
MGIDIAASPKLRLADKAKNLQDQARLLEMAQEWFRLANEADAVEGGNGKVLISSR